MGSVSVITFQGEELYYTDLSSSSTEEVISICRESRQLMKKFAFNSVHSLINVQGMRFNSDALSEIKETVQSNKPYVKVTAICGLEGFTKILIKTISSFSKREMKIIDNLEEAKLWLKNKAREDKLSKQLIQTNYSF